jgi:V/A-type H+-transporting ATPase subunit A
MILGTVPETESLEHRVMVTPEVNGTLKWIAPEGEYAIEDPIAKVQTDRGEVQLTMLQHWPVRRPRPYKSRLGQSLPLITGQRVLDTFFPVAKGGAAGIPGPFGSGKTVTQHSIAKWADAQVIVYIGCGERGNEMTEVLQEFPHLIDPRSGHPLMERTVLIANTSNMPVAAREASIYTGITIAEYYRDMGYHVALMADSTSRWAEALREVSGRLEEMPAEEGYPAYLAGRLAEFYERAGNVETLNGNSGSVTIVGAVSPPGGDFSEPVTQHTKRYIRCFWALDKSLASARHFPSINWLDSYSEYLEDVAGWWRNEVGVDWLTMRNQAMEILSEEDRLSQIVKLVGPDALPDEQRLILETARLLREGFLQQNAMDDIDAFSTVQKQIRMLGLILHFHERALRIVKRSAPISVIHNLPVVDTLIRMKTLVPNEDLAKMDEIQNTVDEQMNQLDAEYK